MSAYRVIELNLSREDSILDGLLALGLTSSEIEVHGDPIALYGYQGDVRDEKANVIVRRKFVNQKLSGGASNDIGFVKEGGKYRAIVSDFDQGWWGKASKKFRRAASESEIKAIARKKGYSVKKTTKNKVTKLILTKF